MKKQVQFNMKPQIHLISQSDESRNGYIWIQYAMDRERFRRRINQSESSLSAVLKTAHRESIYQSRFAPL